MAHGVLRHDQVALVHHVDVLTGHLHREVEELDRTDGLLVHDQSHGLGEVARVGVLLASNGARNVLAVRQVVALVHRHVGNHGQRSGGQSPGPTPLLVEQVRVLDHHVILNGLEHDVPVGLRDILLVEGLRSLEEELAELRRVGSRIGVGQRRAAEVVRGRRSGTGREIPEPGNLLVEPLGEAHPKLMGVFLADVEVQLGVLQVVDEDIRDEEVVDVDDALPNLGVVAPEDGRAGRVVTRRSLTEDGERRALAVRDGTDTVEVAEDGGGVECRQNLSAEHLQEIGVLLSPGTVGYAVAYTEFSQSCVGQVQSSPFSFFVDCSKVLT